MRLFFMIRALLTCLFFTCAQSVNSRDVPVHWELDKPGVIRNDLNAGNPPVVLCMQGRRVVVECHVQSTGRDDCVNYLVRFFGTQEPNQRTRLVFRGGMTTRPNVITNGNLRRWWRPKKVEFDGRLIIYYGTYHGVSAKRTIYPSTTKALLIEEWTMKNESQQETALKVASSRIKSTQDDRVEMYWASPGIEQILQPGEELQFHGAVRARRLSQELPEFDLAAERRARMEIADAAWNGPGRLEVPDPMLVAAYNLQKLHVLEAPIQTDKGAITHNGSLTYSPGIWANDPVEYSSPLFPFFGDQQLNEASMNMYRVWLDHCREHGIDPFPGSFQEEYLKLVQKHRGDEAMVLYGLSKFLLFLGDRKAAEELWPLIEFSMTSIENHMTPEGVIASKADEMEGRYPTGDANLSTAALAYGGYQLAAHLARALDKPEMGANNDQRADALATSIESYFGATVEGFDTYRYYEGNTTLRGWILLPLAMGIQQRETETLSAMLSDKLWPGREKGGDILAESTRETEWGRETYYALRVLFKAGRTDKALELTRKVVATQIFGPRGPYPDEDAIDMLCPGSLYPRVFTEGVFGIVPTGFRSFECTPWLPTAWPKMALRDVRAFGKSWDIVVERDGEQQKVTVTSEGKIVMQESGAPGKTYSVNLKK